MINTDTNVIITDIDRRRLGTVLENAFSEGLVERRYLEELEDELERAMGVDPCECPDDVVTMNSTVRLRDLESGVTTTCTIVYPDEEGPADNRISVLDPLGTAIIGCREGDVVTVRTIDGTATWCVEEVVDQPEERRAQAQA